MEKRKDIQLKKWEKPQLIVVVRGRPEEAVLSDCKHPIAPFGPGSSVACSQSLVSCTTLANS